MLTLLRNKIVIGPSPVLFTRCESPRLSLLRYPDSTRVLDVQKKGVPTLRVTVPLNTAPLPLGGLQSKTLLLGPTPKVPVTLGPRTGPTTTLHTEPPVLITLLTLLKEMFALLAIRNLELLFLLLLVVLFEIARVSVEFPLEPNPACPTPLVTLS